MISKQFVSFIENIGIDQNRSKEKAMAIKSFNWIVFWTLIASTLWIFFLLVIDQPNAIIFPIIGSISIPIFMGYFSYTKNFINTLNCYLLMLLTLPASVQIFHGGFVNSGLESSWCVVAPLMAMAFKPPKQAKNCFFFFLTVIAILVLIELFALPEFIAMSKEIILFQFVMNLIGVVTLCFFPILGFSKELYKLRKIIQESNFKIINSINYAKYIQNATLLSKEELNGFLMEKSILFFEPKDIVSGDFYWAHRNGDEVFLACADCTGHGVPGAFMTMIGINHLNSIVRENKEEDPSRILSLLHEKVVSSLKSSTQQIHDGMDISICKINYKEKRVEYASAMSKIFHFDGEKIINCPVDKCSIGDSRREISYTNQVLQLKEGDSLYLSTDGYIDQFGGPRDKKFGSTQLVSLLTKLNGKSLTEQENLVQSSFESWKGDTEQIDDVTLIGIHF